MRIFMTGASGFIGSAVAAELHGAGHQVSGIARSKASADKLRALGVEPVEGSLDDTDGLKRGAAASDGVVHMGFIHDFSRFADSVRVDNEAVGAMCQALSGSTTQRPFVLASGILSIAPGTIATEHTEPARDAFISGRLKSADLALSYADKGVRPHILRLPPTVHGQGDHGFVPYLIGVARDKKVSGYIGDGSNRWPAVHRLDAATLVRLVIENPKAPPILHPIHDEGIPTKQIAEVIGKQLGVPAQSVAPADAPAHFAWMAPLFGFDSPASSALTREALGWQPTHPGLIEDLEQGHYFGK